MFNIIYRVINYEKDIEEIISLLGKSFSSNHNKEDFLWKHFDNPFGKSYGLLAIDNNSIIGLRMFMRWEFKINGQIIKSIRPVDTCTHPNYQGKGIFKGLTLTGLDNVKDEHDLIFNTPNENSRPGYLKMGWAEFVKINQYKLGVVNLVNKTIQFDNVSYKDLNYLYLNANDGTNISTEFLKWRYRKHFYKIAKFDSGGFLIYKIERIKGIKMLILFEIFGDVLQFPNYLTSVCMKNNLIIVYFLDSVMNRNLGVRISLNRGKQVVVYKNDKLKIVNKIHFSLGDLEGKL